MKPSEGVRAAVYHHRAAHKTGIVVVELNGAESTATIESTWKPVTGRFHRRSSHGPDEELSFSATLSVLLKPYEVCVLCFDLGS
ncbi:MAG: hypothetical protein HZB26_08630 [Candidatus Hydrogenedentes bacterium]|nr:hypothetical protein [Candidatus Hydrogenedentota bacterium]